MIMYLHGREPTIGMFYGVDRQFLLPYLLYGRIALNLAGPQRRRVLQKAVADPRPYIRQLMANVSRFSCLTTSGTNKPGVPCHPSGEVVPPRPAK